MVEKITNRILTGVQQIKNDGASYLPAGYSLPEKDTIVAVIVMSSKSGISRIMIEGKVFQASLPVTVNVGDVMLGRILSTDPFTIALDDLLGGKVINDSLVFLMLSKLHINHTGESNRALRTYLTYRKPVIKSKLQKIIEYLEASDEKIDQKQLDLIIELASMNENLSDLLNDNFRELFRTDIYELIEDISVTAAGLLNSPDFKEIEELSANLLLDLSDSDRLGNIRNILDASGLLKKINRLIHDRTISVKNKELLDELRLKLSAYYKQKYYYRLSGMSPEFVLIRSGEEIHSVKYSVTESRLLSGQTGYKINIRTVPPALGSVITEGMLSGDNLGLTVYASGESLAALRESSAELSTKIKSILKIDSKVIFREPREGNSEYQINSPGSVNVKA